MNVVPSGRLGTVLLSIAATIVVVKVVRSMAAKDPSSFWAKVSI